jgi:hypothetical protein
MFERGTKSPQPRHPLTVVSVQDAPILIIDNGPDEAVELHAPVQSPLFSVSIGPHGLYDLGVASRQGLKFVHRVVMHLGDCCVCAWILQWRTAATIAFP